jgi:hypothetical protein
MRSHVLPVAIIFLCISASLAQNIGQLQEICHNNGKPLHISLMSIPTKGHINPLLGVGQQLAKLGCRVTIPIVEVSKKMHISTETSIQIVS